MSLPIMPNGTRVMMTYCEGMEEVGLEGYIIGYAAGEYRVTLDNGHEILAADDEFVCIDPSRL